MVVEEGTRGELPSADVLVRLSDYDFELSKPLRPGKQVILPIGGVAALDSNSANSIEVDLEPGRYGIICFLPDVKDGKPHFLHGMAKDIVVE